MLNARRSLMLIFITCAAIARAETIELKDGTVIVGPVVDENDTTITVKVKFGTIQYPKNEIKSRKTDDAAPEPAKSPANETAKVPTPKPETKKPIAPPPSAARSTPAAPQDPAQLSAPVQRPAVQMGPGTLGGSPSGSDPHEDSSARDVIVLKDGTQQLGFLVSESDEDVVFDIVMSGRKVSKTILSRTTFKKGEIDSIKKLSDADRAAAIKDLDSAAKETKLDAAGEQNVRVEATTWPLKADPTKLIPVKKVELDHFTIESDANEELLRKLAFRIDKVFKAYAQHFGADRDNNVKVRVMIFNSMESYYGSVADITGGVKNPAFYNSQLKQICAGCDVAKYEQEVVAIREYHRQLDIKLQEWKINLEQARADVRAKVSRAYDKLNAGGKGATVEGQAAMEQIKQQEREWQLQVGAQEKEVNGIQDEIFSLNRRNDVVFASATQQMLATMYHEGFHAFVDNYLFTPEQARLVPRWLNEGLAQYFESARLENGHFILGQDVRERLALLKRFRNGSGLFTLEQLVNGGASDYMVHEIANLERSTKNYLQAWLLTNVLGAKGRLKREILQAYIQELAAKRPPLEALKTLSGMPNEELEKLMDEKLSPTIQAVEEKK